MSVDPEAVGPGATVEGKQQNRQHHEKSGDGRPRRRNRRRGRGKKPASPAPEGHEAKRDSPVPSASSRPDALKRPAPARARERGDQRERQDTRGQNARAQDARAQDARAQDGRAKSDTGKAYAGSKQAFQQNRSVYSAIDLGTNNCRLLIARPTKGGFRVIDAFSRIVRLGEGVANGNRLSDAAMDRTIEALKVCAEKIARRNVTCMRHVATEACRVADNAEEFIARVKRETGLNLDIISAKEEARLAVMGCQSLIAPGNRHALVFDIGGGSTELIWVRVLPGNRSEISGWMSIPWGVVNLSESHGVVGKSVPREQYAQMIAIVEKHLKEFEAAHRVSEVVRRRQTQFLGTSGTVTTLASLHLELPRYMREKVDGAWMKSKDIHALSRRVAEMSHIERSAQPCIGPERADLVVAGCAILEAILGMWNVPSLRVADRGIREGILRGMMQMDEPTDAGRPRRRFGQGRKPDGQKPDGRKQNKVRANG